MKHFLLLLLALMAGTYLQAQEQLTDISLFEAHHHIEGNDTLPYRLCRSEKADTKAKALPLVIFLHGAGERGNDNCMQLKHCINYFLEDTVTSRYPFLLMVPQCPNDRRWVNTDWSLLEHTMDSVPTIELSCVMTVVDSLINCGAVDASRVYLAGISMGGFGVWDALQRCPEKFAAAIAICGGGETVMPLRSLQMYKALKDVGNEEAVLVTYPELGHGCWDEAFSTPGLFKWLFEKKK